MSFSATRRGLFAAGAAIITSSVAGCLGSSRTSTAINEPLAVSNAHQYSSPGCACCGQYASYLRDHLDTELSETVPQDVSATKRRHGIPAELQSCHTIVLDEYVVEGHIPVEVIATVLNEQPEIGGIALPGMPAGSPGMGGTKRGAFTIYAVGGGRTGDVYTEF